MQVTLTFQQEKDDILQGVPEEFVKAIKQTIADDVNDYFDRSETTRMHPKKLTKSYKSMIIEPGFDEPQLPGTEGK
jgi:hypothetical protein